MDNPRLENRPQLNKDKRNTDLLSTERIKSYPILSSLCRYQLYRTGLDVGNSHKELIWGNIEYKFLCPADQLGYINELAGLIVIYTVSER